MVHFFLQHRQRVWCGSHQVGLGGLYLEIQICTFYLEIESKFKQEHLMTQIKDVWRHRLPVRISALEKRHYCIHVIL